MRSKLSQSIQDPADAHAGSWTCQQDSTGSTTGKWQKQRVALHPEWPEQSAGHSLPLRRKKRLALVSGMLSKMGKS